MRKHEHISHESEDILRSLALYPEGISETDFKRQYQSKFFTERSVALNQMRGMGLYEYVKGTEFVIRVTSKGMKLLDYYSKQKVK